MCGWPVMPPSDEAPSASYCRSRCVDAPPCTTQLETSHGTEFHEVFYRWHPWLGLRVAVHEVVQPIGRRRLPLYFDGERRPPAGASGLDVRSGCLSRCLSSGANAPCPMAELSALSDLV